MKNQKSKVMRRGRISEIFFSIQGEGIFAGIPCYFVRFFGCNKKCSYCDTVYALNGKFKMMTSSQIKKKIREKFPVVITGGEPTFQMGFLEELVTELRSRRIWLETNGFKPVKKLIKNFAYIAFHVEPPVGDGERKFIREIAGKPFSVKIVMTKKVKFADIKSAARFLKKFNDVTLILQPESNRGKIAGCSVKKSVSYARKLYSEFPFIRVLPQIHKVLDLK